MSSIVLKRKYEMQLPINYVEVEKDEMEYIDGGATAHTIKRSYSKSVISVPVNALGWAFTGGAISKGISMLSGTAAAILGGAIGEDTIASVVAGFTSSWWNFGDHLANYLDSNDIEPNNGRLDFYDTVWY